MKNIEPRLVALLKEGYCTPLISQIAKKLHEPGATIHYNIKKLEKEGAIQEYRAVFDYSKIDRGFCSFLLIKLSQEEYADPEKVGKVLAGFSEIESVDVITGDYEILVKIRVKDQNAYYSFVKKIASIPGIIKTFSLVSFNQLKSEFVEL